MDHGNTENTDRDAKKLSLKNFKMECKADI